MLIPNRNFNEKYYINRKKILQDFLKDEETETLKNIDDTENLVSKTKMILKGIVTGEYDYSIIKERLAEIDNDLVTDCENYNKDLENLTKEENEIAKQTIDLQKQEEKGTEAYLQKIESLKNELESKEFTIQNRAGKGLVCAKNCKIIDAVAVDATNKIFIAGTISNICLAVSEITLGSRASTGIKAIKNGDIIAITKV